MRSYLLAFLYLLPLLPVAAQPAPAQDTTNFEVDQSQPMVNIGLDSLGLYIAYGLKDLKDRTTVDMEAEGQEISWTSKAVAATFIIFRDDKLGAVNFAEPIPAPMKEEVIDMVTQNGILWRAARRGGVAELSRITMPITIYFPRVVVRD